MENVHFQVKKITKTKIAESSFKCHEYSMLERVSIHKSILYYSQQMSFAIQTNNDNIKKKGKNAKQYLTLTILKVLAHALDTFNWCK